MSGQSLARKVAKIGDSVWIVTESVHQRVSRGGHGLVYSPGECLGTGTMGDRGTHGHSVPLTAVQTALVADQSFIRAYYGGSGTVPAS